MVTIGPFSGAFASTTFSRVSSVLGRNVILANLTRNEAELFRVQEQLSTGLRILRPSDDPVGAQRVLSLQGRVRSDEQFLRNLDAGIARLTMSDSATDDANELLTRAREILLEQVQSTATTESRQAAATEVNLLLQQAVNLGNTRFQDRFLFGGSRTQAAPFVVAGGGVAFTGDFRDFNTEVADGLTAPTNINADRAFGVLSDEIRGVNLTAGPTFLQAIDLNPAVTAATRLSALNGGEGVSLGSIRVTGSGTAVINLGIAESVGDVIDLINAQTAATGVTAAINPAVNGLRLTSASPITVEEVNGGSTAANLGILVTGAASPFDGADVDPILTAQTLVGDLFAGTGISSSGLLLSNVTATAGFTAALGAATFGAGVTVGEVLNDLNNADVFVEARLSASGRGVDVFSRLSGGRLRISENGGTTATQLGLLSTLARAKLEDVNTGLGIGTVDGSDLRITRKDGVQVLFDVDSAANVQGVADAIDADPGLAATIVGGTSIEVTDTTGGAGPLTIEDFNGSFAATNLGIAGTTAGATLTGTALSFVGVQPVGLHTALIRLRDALQADDAAAIGATGRLVDEAQETVLDSRAETGARMSGLELTKNRLEAEKVELEKLLSATRDVDLAEAATRFQTQQLVLESSLAVAARILQTSLLNFL